MSEETQQKIKDSLNELQTIIKEYENIEKKIPTDLKIEQLEKDNKNLKYRLQRIERWIESMPEYWNWGSPPEF